jgi:hypothetical protein
MTLAARACVTAIAAAALVLSAATALLLVPRPEADASPHVAATAWPGGPIVPASLPHALAAATGPISNITSVGSLNWAGYAVSRRNSRFDSVRATFFVPYLNCAKSPGATLSSDWVGLDGFVGTPDSVEQGGIGADCSSAGKATYYAWWEMFPRAETRTSVRIRAGDSVTATVSYSPAHKDFRISLADNTRGGTFAVTRKCPDIKIGKRHLTCPRNSAEVITEAPATGSAKHVVIAHLSDYGAVSFADLAIVSGSGHHGALVSTHWSTTKIIQLGSSSGPVVAQPTGIRAATFDTYWLRED